MAGADFRATDFFFAVFFFAVLGVGFGGVAPPSEKPAKTATSPKIKAADLEFAGIRGG